MDTPKVMNSTRRAHAAAATILLALALVGAATLPAPARAADLLYPRLGLYGQVNGAGEPVVGLNGQLDPVVLDQIARHHMVVLNATPFTEYRPQALGALRVRRPDLTLLAYVQAAYVYPAFQPDSTVNLPTRAYNMVRNMNGFLYDRQGEQFRNANINLAKRSGGRYVMAEAMADFFVDRVLGPGDWDGLFLDRFCNSIAWDQSPTDSVDFVRAGYPTFAAFDQAWLAATDTLANRLRRRAGNAPILVGNCGKGTKYASFNGWMRENFPFQGGGTWQSNVFGDPGGYLLDQGRFRSPYVGWLTAWPSGGGDPYATASLRQARIALATATLGDGYGTINPPDIDPTTGYMSWWYDEYAVDRVTGRSSTSIAHTGWLGRARGPYSKMVWAQTGVEDACDLNPGFELPLTTGWLLLTTNGATAVADGSTAMEGLRSARLQVPSSTGGVSAVRFRTLGDVFYISQPYSATFWARSSVPRTIEVAAVDGSGNAFWPVATETLKTTWTRHQVVLNGSFGYARLELRLGGSASTVWLDDVHFQRGAPFVYRRDFDYGTVLLNVGEQPLDVVLERRMRHIAGTRDPVANDGSEGSIVGVPSGDAAFLLLPLEDLVDAGEPRAGVAAGALAWAGAAPNPSARAGGPVRLTLAAPADGEATVALYDVAGRQVRRLHDGPLAAGRHVFAWDGHDDEGRATAPGLYFARARLAGDVAVHKLVRRD
jgi:hypothetical protein